MYGYYDMGWMLYVLIESLSVIDIIISLFVIKKKVHYKEYEKNLKYHICIFIIILLLGISRGIRISTSDLLDIYFLDIKYFLLQITTLLGVFGLRYLIKKKG